MGYNTVMLVPNRDLHHIAGMAGFGALLAHAMRRFPDWADGEKGMPAVAMLADMAEQIGMSRPGIGIEISAPLNSSHDAIHLIRRGQLIPFLPGWRMPDYPAYAALAEMLSALGYEIHDAETGHAWYPRDPAAHSLHAWMSGWDETAIEDGATVFCMTHGAIDQMAADHGLGQRLEGAVRSYAAQSRQIAEMGERSIRLRNVFAERDVAVGNFANPITIIGMMPSGRDELLAAGRNSGRMLRPFPGLREVMSAGKAAERHEELRAEGFALAVQILRCSGFSIRPPGAERLLVPFLDRRDFWPKRPAVPARAGGEGAS